MRFNVAQLMKDPPGSVRRYSFQEAGISLDEGQRADLEGEAQFFRTSRGILATVDARTWGDFQCSRCLAPFRQPMQLHFEEEHLPLEAREGDAFLIDENHNLDLDEALRQYFLTAIPIKLLCHPDCRGLCPTCGADLNQGPCSCKRELVSPVWAKLREWAKAQGLVETEGNPRQ